jgi:predicted MFS family arabinose efflux permease
MHKFSTSHAALAGLSGSLVGIGLGRFAYTPLIPPLIDAGWFPPSQVVYLGAANLAGYLAGALLARPIAAHLRASHILRAMMLLASAACFACAAPLSLPWFFAWRFAAGLAGGVIMVLAAPTILPHVDPRRRGLVSGLIFTGVGLGIAASGTLVPLLLRFGLVATWCGLGAVSLGLTMLAWGGWPATEPIAASHPQLRRSVATVAIWGLLAEYGLNAAGLVPHMVFLVDFVARGLHAGLTVGAGYWVVFGVGAMAGPLLAGALADRIGFGVALRVAFATQAAAVVLPVLTDATPWLVVSSALAGAFTPGIVPLALGRVHELLPGNPVAQRLVWGRTTMAWALFQAGAAYFDSWLFGQTGGDYRLLFALGAGALTLALTIDLVAGRQSAAAATPPIRPSSA